MSLSQIKESVVAASPLTGRRFELIAICVSPLLAFACVLAVGSYQTVGTQYALAYAALLLTFAHINLGFLRSHANRAVFHRFKLRLSIVPILLILSLSASPPLFTLALMLAIQWDDYHTAMQTFAFARLYDRVEDNQAERGRRIDLILCCILEIFPTLYLLSYLPVAELLETLANEFAWQPSSSILSTIVAMLVPLRWFLLASSSWLAPACFFWSTSTIM